MTFRRFLLGLLPALFAGATAASAFLVWFNETFFGVRPYRARGFDTSWGKALFVVACVGVVIGLGAGWMRRPWPRIANLLLGLAGISAVVVAAATYHVHGNGDQWTAASSYWVALGVTIAWVVSALGATYRSLRKPSLGFALWLHDPYPPVSRWTLMFTSASLSAVFLFVGAIGPWQTIGVASSSGLDNSQDGMIVLAAAFFASLGLLAYFRFGNRRALLFVLLLSLGAAAIDIYDLHRIASKADVSSGWGINLAAEASVALAGSTLLLLFRRGRSLVRHTSLVDTDRVAAGAGPETMQAGPLLGP